MKEEKNIAKDTIKGIHIAYAGNPFNSTAWVAFPEIMQKITSQGLHLHSYGYCANKKEHEFYIEEEKKNPYFHYHPKLNPKELNKEMSNYHWGIIPQFFNPSEIDERWIKTTMSNKLFNYIEAGLPVIVGTQKEGSYMADICEKYGVGLVIEYEDLPKLRLMLEICMRKQ